VPVLKKMNPSLEKTFGITSQRLGSAEILLNSFLKVWKKEVAEDVNGDLYISINAVLNSPEPAYGLWFILQDFGFSHTQAQEIFLAAKGISGKVFHSGTHQVLKDRDSFIVSKKEDSEGGEELIIDYQEGIFKTGKLMFELRKFSKPDVFTIDKKTSLIFLDFSQLVFPLVIRSWTRGDAFFPFGMKGKRKKVSDLFIDLKLNVNQKQKAKVLCNGNGDILWVIGLRTDERYKIKELTKEIIEITFSEDL
jgi:tRNA(Ile)-lysidine synthase